MNLPQQVISVMGAATMAAMLWAQTGPAELARVTEQPVRAVAAAAEQASAEAVQRRIEATLVEQDLMPGPEYFWASAMGYNRTVEVVVSR